MPLNFAVPAIRSLSGAAWRTPLLRFALLTQGLASNRKCWTKYAAAKASRLMEQLKKKAQAWACSFAGNLPKKIKDDSGSKANGERAVVSILPYRCRPLPALLLLMYEN